MVDQVDVTLSVIARGPEAEILLHHFRLGYPLIIRVGCMYPYLFKKVDKSILVCDACAFGKHTRSTYPSIGLRSDEPFLLIHSDVWGPCSVTSVSGFKWFVTFMDCCTRMTCLIYLMKHKSEVVRWFQDFHKLVAT